MHCVVCGIPLPDLGSFEYHLLETGLARQRAEKIAFARLLAGLVGPLTGLEEDQVNLLVTGYAESVFQVKYNYKYTTARIRSLEQRRQSQLEDLQLMRKVDAMTVTEDK